MGETRCGEARSHVRLHKAYGAQSFAFALGDRVEEEEGKMIIKARLVLKGYAESNQTSLQTAAPPATRSGHRIIVLSCTLHNWEIWSLDVSTAFLQGWTFQELRESGYERQPVAFKVPNETFEILSELDSKYQPTLKRKDD